LGRPRYWYISFRDLYSICVKYPAFFEELVKCAGDPEELKDKLLAKGLILPEACLKRLARFLGYSVCVAQARVRIEDGDPWPGEGACYVRAGGLAKPCIWGNCPT
jgi:hypothetical protein